MPNPFARREVAAAELAVQVHAWLQEPGRRFGHLTARLVEGGRPAVEVLLLDTRTAGGVIFTSLLPADVSEYPSLSPGTPAAHWAERALGDFFGIRAAGHPRWKSLVLHNDVWPQDRFPLAPDAQGHRDAYTFLDVHGEGIHEIPVGPIHAGIIEPGHFRFSCVGEIITNLEIRLGYQHRGVEKRLAEVPWQQARYQAESASSDTAVGNALAHAVAMEQLLGIEAPARAQALRTMALEVERLANHLGDVGALAGDIGYSAGAALFAPLRGSALRLGQLLAGSRLQRWYVRPGGVARDLADSRRHDFAGALEQLSQRALDLLPVVLDNPAAIERMEWTGRLRQGLAREFGLVGPAARASGSDYDARAVYPHGLYPARAPMPARRKTGDVLARAQVRAEEIRSSFALLAELVDDLPAGAISANCHAETLPADAVGIGIVEAWRGELIHWVTTGAEGAVSRYAIKDPSFNNWTGLAIAVRGNLVADFPLCNKSFNLSYSGNDL